MQIIKLTNLTTEQLLELEAVERQMFEEAGLNRWTLPVIVRYGYLFALCRCPKAPSSSRGEGWGEGDIFGLASFICKEKTAFLIGLWVKEDSQNQGLGEKILTETIAALKVQNIKALELTVDENNVAACKLYQKMDFEFVEKLDDFYGPNQGRALLKRNIMS